jgi:DNA (cytosine-5)-methyltransferase 1
LGGILLGHTCVCAVEIEPYRRGKLLQRQRDGILPRFPIWDDVLTFDGTPWQGKAEVVCGGFPCQDISLAGKGAGIGGTKSGLWKEFARVIGEVRPRYVFIENSPELVNRGLSTILCDLAEMGYNARWCCLDGNSVGLPQSRNRIWILAELADTVHRDRSLGRDVSRSVRLLELVAENMAGKAKSEPPMVGVANGLADRMDSNRAIGDGQIPIVAALAWDTLST